MRVLLTDDSKTIRMVLRDVLTQLGHSDVHEAENGAKALEMVANGGFEVILLDLHMPVLDGLGTLKQLKADAKTAHIPVVIISSDTDMRVIDQAHKAPNLASTLNQGAFNLGNALGAWVGGAMIGAGLPLTTLPLVGAGVALLALGAVVVSMALDRRDAGLVAA